MCGRPREPKSPCRGPSAERRGFFRQTPLPVLVAVDADDDADLSSQNAKPEHQEGRRVAHALFSAWLAPEAQRGPLCHSSGFVPAGLST
jgi:hypothetical protein